jgi:hypothetical protein
MASWTAGIVVWGYARRTQANSAERRQQDASRYTRVHDRLLSNASRISKMQFAHVVQPSGSTISDSASGQPSSIQSI